MLRNYLLVAFRSMRRQPGYAAVNVVGLAAGLACCLLIALLIRDELAYDRHHAHGERIVRLASVFGEETFPVTASAVAPTLRREAPEVEAAARLFDSGMFGSAVVARGDRRFEEGRFFYADSTVFAVFSLPLAGGDPATALTRPQTVVLTAPAARRYFGTEDPLGQTLAVNGRDFEVTGVLEPLPATSHLAFDFLASFETLAWAQNEIWTSANFFTYLLLRDASAVATLPGRLAAVLAPLRADGLVPEGYGLRAEPLYTIHLDGSGRRLYVRLFSAIAVLILLVACVNYMNLATARATQRAREVGVRKATGAHRGQLVAQFYAEAGVLVAISLVLGLGGAALLTPAFRAVTGKALTLSLADPVLWSGLLVVGVLVTLLAGSYPALLLASFRPAQALKGGLRVERGGVRLRQGLVVFQFAVSVFLLVGTAVIFGQLRYAQRLDLGFRGEQVVALPVGDRQALEALPVIKGRLEAEPGVRATAAIDRLPGRSPGGYSLTAEGFDVPEEMDYYPLAGVPTEPGVVEALGLDLRAGRDLRASDRAQPEPGAYEYLVNETTLRTLGWAPEEALGRRFSARGDHGWGTVVGVFRDYHFLPIHEPIGPLAMWVEPTQTNHLLVRLAPGDVSATLARVEAVWAELVPHRPFTYTFLDAAFAAHYEAERRLARLFAGFAMWAVLIACLGVLGLAAHAAERRRKEVGIRKALGASVGSLVALLSREFALLVAVGFAVAVPLAYLAMSYWLDGFAYRIGLGAEFFMAAGAIALALALATAGGQALRAATADPVEALRAE